MSAVKDLETAQLSRASEHSDGSSAHQERGFPARHNLTKYRVWPVSDWGLDSREWVTAALSREHISPQKAWHCRPAGPICWRQSSPRTVYPGLQAFLGPLASACPTLDDWAPGLKEHHVSEPRGVALPMGSTPRWD